MAVLPRKPPVGLWPSNRSLRGRFFYGSASAPEAGERSASFPEPSPKRFRQQQQNTGGRAGANPFQRFPPRDEFAPKRSPPDGPVLTGSAAGRSAALSKAPAPPEALRSGNPDDWAVAGSKRSAPLRVIFSAGSAPPAVWPQGSTSFDLNRRSEALRARKALGRRCLPTGLFCFQLGPAREALRSGKAAARRV